MIRYWQEVMRGAALPAKQKKLKEKHFSYKTFYQSDAWRAVRYEALKLHGARCQCCGATPKTGAVMHVDHIKPRIKYPELELVLANLQVLCEACNMGKKARDETDWRPQVLLGKAEDNLETI